MLWIITGLTLALLVAETIVVAVLVRCRRLDRWLPSWLFGMDRSPRLNQPVSRPAEGADTGHTASTVTGHQTPWLRLQHGEPLTLFIAVCDHYEPDNAQPARHVADSRVDRWCREYPELFGRFEDSRGQAPQHSFFYPQDEYFVPGYLDQLRDLCADGYGDVEIHLHHDADTADGFREKLESFRDTLHHRHGLLRRHPVTGELAYGFIHGNWALCNSRPDGRWCGVNDELTILRETGCFADFTMPSAPDACQTRIINSIYYAASQRERPAGHDRGTRATLNNTPPGRHLLMIQGPLALDLENRTRRVLPRIENGDLLWRRPATIQRLKQWIRCGVHVAGRPDWCFIKLHTHGCKDGNIDTLLGEGMQNFHRELAGYAQCHAGLRYYYVTAWEMAQMVKQAEAGGQCPAFEASAESAVERELVATN